MSTPTDPRLPLARLLVALGRDLPPAKLSTLSASLERSRAVTNLGHFGETTRLKERLRKLEELSTLQPDLDPQAIAFALQVAAQAAVTFREEQGTEIAWTGPSTQAVPLRRVDQVIYEIVERAKNEVLLVTYAAFKAERALKALRDASDRGLRVKFVIELKKASGGKISFDGYEALREAVPLAQIFYWPPERRPHSTAGSYGAMHAKEGLHNPGLHARVMR
jgi:phosphatidylserine/phosphatidylglycerophosphate/cardiolipin synthase-like enzyme